MKTSAPKATKRTAEKKPVKSSVKKRSGVR